LFETATLISTEKITRFPVVLYGKEYWNGLAAWLRDCGVGRGYLQPADFEMFTITDDVDQVISILSAWRTRGQLEGQRLA
jgi:predicted Rossmann-fold nucleotide-binding protein